MAAVDIVAQSAGGSFTEGVATDTGLAAAGRVPSPCTSLAFWRFFRFQSVRYPPRRCYHFFGCSLRLCL